MSIEAIIIAFLAALPPTIVAIAAMIQAKANAKIIIGKNDEIHTLVNSNLTEVKDKLAEANKRIAQLLERLSKD